MADATLWDDNPSELDLLGFDAVVAPILGALDTPDLDPLTIGVHAPWGGGKSTILGLLDIVLAGRNDYLVIRTDPWEYDDLSDVKGTLIAEVLGALETHFAENAGLMQRTKGLLRRISWGRVGVALAKGSIAMQWDADDLIDAFTPRTKQTPESMTGFREAFGELLGELGEVKRVVVLVDDLDRCLPDAVMATLEAIKLFLSVRKMVFVIAADQDMVRDGIAASLGNVNRSEAFADRYLEKIVQLPITLPRLAPQDAEAYIALLLCRGACEPDQFAALVQHSRNRRARRLAPLIADFEGLPWRPPAELLLLSAQLTHGLGADRATNPRVIKRFLNAFGVRQQIAVTRDIQINPDAIMKLLLLEDRYRSDFDRLVGTPSAERAALLTNWEAWARDEVDARPSGVRDVTKAWAVADPRLAGLDLDPYITLAASLASATLGAMLSSELASILAELMSESEAVRGVAVEKAANRSIDEQTQLVEAVLSHARRSEDVSRNVSALVGIARRVPGLADLVASGIKRECWTRLTPASAVDVATSGTPALVALGRDMAVDEALEGDVREAARQALQLGGA